MNVRIPKWITILICTTLLLLSACSPGSDDINSRDQDPFSNTADAAEREQLILEEGNVEAEVDAEISTFQEMVAFQGTVFVSTSQLIAKLWHDAGWRISDRPIDTDSGDIPVDCTLYPHLGVANQWVGSCAGNILVPKNGAQHIAVMVTEADGTISMVQVAPDPKK